MKFKPILFSTEMVRAILEGRKTQTRRILQLKHLDPLENVAIFPDGSGKGWIAWQPAKHITAEFTKEAYPGNEGFPCPKGAVGDVLWVRESFCFGAEDPFHVFFYKASDQVDILEDGDGFTVFNKDGTERSPWKPSIHMPKEACRLFLEIEALRVERLQDIADEDAIAEGCWLDTSVGPPGYTVHGMPHWKTAKECYENLWEGINGVGSWERNPFVWVITFKRIDKPENFI